MHGRVGIFSIQTIRPMIRNSALAGLRQRRLEDIHLEIRLTPLSSWVTAEEKESGEKGMNSWVSPA